MSESKKSKQLGFSRSDYIKPKGFIQPYKHVEIESLPVYQKGSETTLNVEEADKDSFGRPIGLGFRNIIVPVTKHKPLCLDPKDPNARLRALEARASMENLSLTPNSYLDKFEAIKQSGDQANALISKLKNK